MVASVATCGAAILPDIDEPGSSVAHEFGFISQGVFLDREQDSGWALEW